MAKVIKEFMGASDHDPRTRRFMPGDEVTGDLAAVAVREGWAVEPESDPPQAVPVREAEGVETTSKKARKRNKPKG